ncbi:hypothetical protein COU61_00870 [Candidatus Pacearchaeota archaeon CG10_big_fil_rev_8_21_14_0_10_35_13]|nr:MAG: hypothetical protein COU61_00870 [Candidatus Pacearchaeota archaeon CG10_big_fil_rev_8_21_14_0_10_35_13]
MGRRKSYHKKFLEEDFRVVYITPEMEDDEIIPIRDLASMITALSESCGWIPQGATRIMPAEEAFRGETWTIENEEERHVMYVNASYVNIGDTIERIPAIDRKTGERLFMPAYESG